MKKVTWMTIIFLFFLGLGFSSLSAHQSDGDKKGMMNQQTGAMYAPQMSPEQIQKMQAAMAKMRATRERMLAAKTPAERQKLMRQHMRDMQTCMNMMPAGQGMRQSGGRHMQMHKGRMMGGMMSSSQGKTSGNQMMGSTGNQGMMMNSRACGTMMQEMMKSMLAQMNMMMQK